jgi:hypothetical protein
MLPSYTDAPMDLVLPTPGTRLGDLVRELELRLSGTSVGPGLLPELAATIPDAASYVLVLFDGLGHHQLDHPNARSLAAAGVARISASFPTTTTVNLATVATGLEPAGHGMISHYMWLAELESVVNVLKWVTPEGVHTGYETSGFLPHPNLWERLKAAGIEPIAVQPGEFGSTPLTKLLYRGCRFEGVYSVDEAVDATVELSRVPGRLVFTYFPQVDVAAHIWGQRSAEYEESLRLVDTAWSQIVSRSSVPTIGTADHGHLDYRFEDKVMLRDPAYDALTFYGDPRSLFVRGDRELIRRVAVESGTEPIWVGAGDHIWREPRHRWLEDRIPDAVLMAPSGRVLLPRGFDRRLTGYHGGLSPEETGIPLLVG